jgi:hypothetical protein
MRSGDAMDWSLREQVSFCWFGERPVFLDLGADRYYCLSTAAEEAFRKLARGAAPPAAGLDALERTGLVVRRGATPVEPVRTRAPQASLVDAPPDRMPAGPIVLVEVALRLARARRRVARTSLRDLIARLHARKAFLSEGDASGDGRRRWLAAGFNAARRGVPYAVACLPDALALLDFIAARGLPADLVFGVRLDPFSAHCWVQADGEVLNDGLGAVAAYSPILVV